MKTQYRLAVALLVATIVLTIGTYVRWWDLYVPLGPVTLVHLLVIVGAAYVLVFVPVYSYAKRHSRDARVPLLKAHVFGNLAAFLLISVHFAQQLGRTDQGAPLAGTGLAAYILVAIIVATGFMQRFGISPAHRGTWRFIHIGLALSLYVVVIVHAARNFGLF